MDAKESIADIVEEMRGHVSGRAEDAWYTPEEWRRLCDRIEEAHRAELVEGADLPAVLLTRDAEAFRKNGVAVVEERGGDAAAMRKALFGAMQMLDQCYKHADMTDALRGDVADATWTVQAALDKPPRNCDRADIQTPWDAVMAWLDATDPERAKLARKFGYEWEPARGDGAQIVEWMLAKADEAKGGTNGH